MATDASPATPTPAAPPFDLTKGRDELNLIDLPLTLPESRRRQLTKEGVRTHKLITPEVWDHDLQQHVVRTVEILPSPDLGFPGTFDNRVLLACTSLSRWMNKDADGRQIDGFLREVPFSTRMMVDVLRLKPSGQTYRRVRESLERWQSTDYRITYPWYDKRKRKRKAVHRFNLLDNVIWDAQDAAEESVFVLNEVLFQSLSSHYVRTIDLDQHGRFKSHHAGEAYRLLGKLFYQNPVQEIPLAEFAFHVAAGECGDNGQLKRKLQPAIRELEDEGIIAAAPKAERFKKHGRGEWTIRFEKPASPHPKTYGKQAELFASPMVDELTARGVWPDIAASLAENHEDAAILLAIEWVEWLDQQHPGKIESLGAFLAGAIARRLPPPPGFHTKAEREASEQAAKQIAAERRRKQDQAEKKAIEERAAELAAQQADFARVEQHLASLPGDESRRLIDEAVAADGLGFARRYRDGLETSEMYRWAYESALRTHLLPLLPTVAVAAS